MRFLPEINTIVPLMKEQSVQDVVKSSSKLQIAKQKFLVFLNKPIVLRLFDN